jgi:Zn-dependent peptidase ImmA (M78 family)
MAVRRKQIRETVQKILTTHNITTAPVDVDKIARTLGIAITRDEVDNDISGFLFRDRGPKKTIIGANKGHHANRQRFTIAHELGHFLLHEGNIVHLDSGYRAFRINLRDDESSKGEDNDEKEANFFAAELLMPAMFLADDLRGRDLDLFDESEYLQKLAKKYKVSVQALTFRLANLGYINL